MIYGKNLIGVIFMVLPIMVIIISLGSLYLLSEYLREKEEKESVFLEIENDREALNELLILTKSTNNQVKSIKYIVFIILVVNIIKLLNIELF